jgi:DNA polymerase/3'-5' exonuclease PolX
MTTALPRSPIMNNADIADRLASLAQLLSTQKENPYKVKAYQRAAAKVRTVSESIEDLVRDGSDLTEYAGIGAAICRSLGRSENRGFDGCPQHARIRLGPVRHRPGAPCRP